MEVIIIAAVAANGVIGNKGKLPWNIPEEMAHFKATTEGHAVLMGYNTYLSLKGPLRNRYNMVLSHNKRNIFEAAVVDSIGLAIATAEQKRHSKLFIIGGAETYKAAMPFADKMIISHLVEEYKGDRYFSRPNWYRVSNTMYDGFAVAEYVPYASDWRYRVNVELEELKGNMRRLNCMIISDKFLDLPAKQQVLLKRQVQIMQELQSVLHERLQ